MITMKNILAIAAIAYCELVCAQMNNASTANGPLIPEATATTPAAVHMMNLEMLRMEKELDRQLERKMVFPYLATEHMHGTVV